MEKVRPWCGQPLDRGRLKNRTEQISPLPVLCAAGILCLWLVCLCVRMSYGHAQQRHSPTGLPSSSSYSIITPHDRGAEYCERCVCLSVCLSVCVCVFVYPRSYLLHCTSDLHHISCVCYLWPWLGSSLAA